MRANIHHGSSVGSQQTKQTLQVKHKALSSPVELGCKKEKHTNYRSSHKLIQKTCTNKHWREHWGLQFKGILSDLIPMSVLILSFLNSMPKFSSYSSCSFLCFHWEKKLVIDKENIRIERCHFVQQGLTTRKRGTHTTMLSCPKEKTQHFIQIHVHYTVLYCPHTITWW